MRDGHAAPCLLASLFLILVGPLTAQAQEGQTEAPSIDPLAEDRLTALSDHLAAAETLHFVALSFFDETEEGGIQIKRFIVHDVRVARPDRLAFTSTFDDGAVRHGWYDGTSLTVAAPADGRYVVIEAAGGIDAMLDLVDERYGLGLPIADILYSNVYAAQQPYMLSAVYLGERVIQNRRFDHVSVESTGADWQIWMDIGDAPTPRRMVMQFIEQEGQPEYMVTFHRFDIDPSLGAEVFEPQIGDDWDRVDPRSPVQ